MGRARKRGQRNHTWRSRRSLEKYREPSPSVFPLDSNDGGTYALNKPRTPAERWSGFTVHDHPGKSPDVKTELNGSKHLTESGQQAQSGGALVLNL